MLCWAVRWPPFAVVLLSLCSCCTINGERWKEKLRAASSTKIDGTTFMPCSPHPLWKRTATLSKKQWFFPTSRTRMEQPFGVRKLPLRHVPQFNFIAKTEVCRKTFPSFIVRRLSRSSFGLINTVRSLLALTTSEFFVFLVLVFSGILWNRRVENMS